jgi:hypothetical protein
LAKAIGLGWFFLFFDQGDFVVGVGEGVVGNFPLIFLKKALSFLSEP